MRTMDEMTMRDPVADPVLLSPRQIDCLRLVHERMNSKEIGRALGLSPHTVDKHVREGVVKLGASNRYHAARMLNAQADTTGERFTGHPFAIPGDAVPGDSACTAPELFGAGRLAGPDRSYAAHVSPPPVLHDAAAAYMPAQTAFPGAVAQAGGRNELDLTTRVGIIFGLAAAMALGFGAIIASLRALSGL
jgi:DNA-binding CsgD family transcriptional regulator